jgi:hypothetical protein
MRMLSKDFHKRPVFAWLFIVGWVALFHLVVGFLRRPLEIDYGISWAIFALFATLNLEYISLGNGLRDKLYRPFLRKRDGSREKGEGIAFLLMWTSIFFTFTILVLGLRIGLHSFCPECQGSENPIPPEHPLRLLFLWFDRLIVSTFLISLVLRVAVFLYSYGGDVLRSLGLSRRPSNHRQAALGGSQSVASS